MPESVLTLLKFAFLALIYLFLWLVVRAAMRELRAPALVGAGGVGTALPESPRAAATKQFATLRVVAPPAREGELVADDGEIQHGPGNLLKGGHPVRLGGNAEGADSSRSRPLRSNLGARVARSCEPAGSDSSRCR